MKVIFDLEGNAVSVRCNYQWQLEEAICRFDPFHMLPTKKRAWAPARDSEVTRG